MSEVTSTLSASEQAHIDSGGETPIEPTTAEVGNTEEAKEEKEEVAEPVTKEPQKTVPLAALHEERARIKKMQAEMVELRQQTQLGNQRLEQIIQAAQQRQAPQVPTLEENPVANFDHRTRQLEQQLHEQAQRNQQYEQGRQQEQQYRQLQQHVGSQIQEYAQTAPDIGDAIGHLQTVDMQALLALGHDEATAQQMVTRHHDELIVNLARQGVNIPERLHALAKARGYTAKSQAPDGQQKIQAVQKGTAAAKSLGGGGAVSNGLSLQALAAMSSEEFSEATSGKNESAWRKLMGG